jgi:hypothetical protein
MIQIVLTSAAGKRLIARAITRHPAIQAALQSGTIAIVAGTTNGYIAEEILELIGQSKGFNRKHFFRGITLPPSKPATETGRLPDEMDFPGDVIIVRGRWQRGKTIFDVADNMEQRDVILKGANALDILQRRGAILIGDPKGGTIAAALKAVIGRRVHLILPVGLEKRIYGNLDEIASRLNASDASGPRFLPVPGEIFTEIEAISTLSGATAKLVAGGGVCGAEGSIRLAISGGAAKESLAEEIIRPLLNEPPFELI